MRKRIMILLFFLVLLVLGLEFFVGFFYFLPLLFSISFYKRFFSEKEGEITENEKEISQLDYYDLDWDYISKIGEYPIIPHQDVDEDKL